MTDSDSPLPPSLVSLLRARREMYGKTPSVLPRVHHELHRVAMEKSSFKELLRRRLTIAAERFRDGTGMRMAVAMLGVAILSAILIVSLTGEGKHPLPVTAGLQPGDVVLKIDGQKKMQVVVSRGRKLLIVSLPTESDAAAPATPDVPKP